MSGLGFVSCLCHLAACSQQGEGGSCQGPATHGIFLIKTHSHRDRSAPHSRKVPWCRMAAPTRQPEAHIRPISPPPFGVQACRHMAGQSERATKIAQYKSWREDTGRSAPVPGGVARAGDGPPPRPLHTCFRPTWARKLLAAAANSGGNLVCQ